MLKIIAAVASLALLSTPSIGAPCRDAHGKFIKCVPKAKPVHCRDAKGHFAKCGTAGAKSCSAGPCGACSSRTIIVIRIAITPSLNASRRDLDTAHYH